MRIRQASQIISVVMVLLALTAVVCLLLARQSRAVSERAFDARLQMLEYTEQLAAGSDRLTAAVRAYAATGDRRHAEDFQREVAVDRNRDRSVEGMRRLGLHEDELALIIEAKHNSDQLVELENRAIAAADQGDLAGALALVYGDAYAAAKASIMEPIRICRERLEKRLSSEAAELSAHAGQLDDLALTALLANAISMLAALILFYRRRVVEPLGRVERSVKALIAGEPGARISHQDEPSEIGELARAIEQYRQAVERAEQQLRHAHFLADSALDLTRSGYWHVPLDGSGWYQSSERAARIFGDPPTPDHRYSLEHWTRQVYAGDEAAARATMDNFAAAVAGDIPVYDSTYAYLRPVDGRVVWIHALGHVVKNAAGEATDIYGVTQDITEFKQLEFALLAAKHKAEEATQMKSMFLANMSHEIRTPMNAIIGLSHLALRTALDARQHDYLSKIHQAGSSLLALINDILDFSKIEAGKLSVEHIGFRLDEVIAQVTTITAQKAQDKGLEFLAQLPDSVPQALVGDPLRLGQVLTNLVNNAIKFTERGEVRVEAALLAQSEQRCQLQFLVRDTGIGMSAGQSARLFQAFTQADMSTTRKHGGTGLGLTICQRLVELMDGTIWLDSTPGIGTTVGFTVWLGLGQDDAASARVPAQLATLDVLVADDNAAAREIIAEALGGIVHRVHTVDSGAAAVAAVRAAAAPVDVVFLDWRMPQMDGLQAARLIRSDETLARQPAIVLVTAFGRDEVRAEAERLHLDGFLLKPVTRSMLLDSLMTVVGTPAAVAPAAVSESIQLPGLRVLLVEDHEINQQIAIELLQLAGVEVKLAGNGLEAVQRLFGDESFDLVLMDLQMPVMDGHEATRRIRAETRLAGLPIIAMTAHATLDERQRCLDAGMVDHVSKPIDPAQLYAALARHAPQRLRTVPTTPTPTLPPADADGLPIVDGLNSADGLARMGGNRALYRKLLQRFLALASTPTEIQAALAADDPATAERLAHTLRGVAGNLGAGGVQDAADALEQALHARANAALLQPLQTTLALRLEALIQPLRSQLAENADSVDAPLPDAAQQQAILQSMLAALDQYDVAASELLAAHGALFRARLTPAQYAELVQHIEGFNYAEAHRMLQATVAPP